MSKSVAKNYLYNVSYQILVILVPLITTPYISRVLGVDNIGIFGYAQSIVNYFVLFGCIGMNIYGQREIAYCRENPEQRSQVFWSLALLRVVTVSVSLVVFYFAIVRNAQYPEYFLIFMVELIAAIFDISWLFQGMENFKLVALRNFIIKLSGVLLIFLFVKTKEQLDLYIWCYAGTILLGNLSLWFYLPKVIKKVPLKKLRVFCHFIPAISLFVPQIAISIYTQLDKTMIGLLSTNAEVGYYTQADKITKLALAIVTSLGAVMLSRIAHVFSKDDQEELNRYIHQSFRFVFFLAIPIMFGLVGISSGFVPWFFGAGWEPVVLVMMVISPVVLLIGLSNVMSNQYLLPTKQVKFYTIAVVSGACVNFVCNLIAIPKWGAIGASVATLLAETAVTAIEFWFVRKSFHVGTIFRYAIKNLLAGLVMLGVIFGFSYILPAKIWATVFEIAAGAAVYFVLLYLLKDTFTRNLFEKGVSLIKRKHANR